VWNAPNIARVCELRVLLSSTVITCERTRHQDACLIDSRGGFSTAETHMSNADARHRKATDYPSSEEEEAGQATFSCDGLM
jgi:hypothetical protein